MISYKEQKQRIEKFAFPSSDITTSSRGEQRHSGLWVTEKHVRIVTSLSRCIPDSKLP